MLHQVEKALYYFQRETSNTAQGKIFLSQEYPAMLQNEKECTFTVFDKSKQRTFYIIANSEIEAIEWIKAINDVGSS